MSRAARLLILLLAIAALAACRRDVKPDLPAPDGGVKPITVVVERRVYVPIPAELTALEPIAEGAVSQCFVVSAERKAGQQRANAKLQQIAEIQGTEVEP